MARIRTVKPEFFRHEGLQDLEAANPGAYPMMVFAGLWGHCDKDGVFEWKPRTLKLDILPFLPFNMAETMGMLAAAGFIERYEVDGKEYGIIRTFQEHQRINGKEAQEPAKHPKPNAPANTSETGGKQQGSTGEAIETTGMEGNGREEEGNGYNPDGLFVASGAADDLLTDGRKKKPATPPCPHQEIIAIYHELLPSNPTIRTWTDAREEALRTRWKEDPGRQNLDYWRNFFTYVAESKFLTGRKSGREGRPFLPGLDWMVKAENFTKIREGRFHQD